MAANAQAKIIRRIEVTEESGHHGGGWKVAYADFMTAMMAFFLLLWILSSSDEQKLRGIAEYFTNATMPSGSGVLDGATLGPPGTLTASNGTIVARGAELGKFDDPSPAKWEIEDTTPTYDPNQKALGSERGKHENPAAGNAADTMPKANPGVPQHPGTDDATGQASSSAQASNPREEQQENFRNLKAEIMQAMQDTPDLRPLMNHVIFDETEEGLQIQIIDQEGQPMFASGRAEMLSATEKLLTRLGTSLAKLENRMVISGHTDAVPFTKATNYDNWDLSSDRAHATRRIFESAGVSEDRFIRVSGLAASDALRPEDPNHPSNRRVTIQLQYESTGMSDRAASGDGETMLHPSTSETKSVDTAGATKETQAEPDVVVSFENDVFTDLRNALR